MPVWPLSGHTGAMSQGVVEGIVHPVANFSLILFLLFSEITPKAIDVLV